MNALMSEVTPGPPALIAARERPANCPAAAGELQKSDNPLSKKPSGNTIRPQRLVSGGTRGISGRCNERWDAYSLPVDEYGRRRARELEVLPRVPAPPNLGLPRASASWKPSPRQEALRLWRLTRIRHLLWGVRAPEIGGTCGRGANAAPREVNAPRGFCRRPRNGRRRTTRWSTAWLVCGAANLGPQVERRCSEEEQPSTRGCVHIPFISTIVTA